MVIKNSVSKATDNWRIFGEKGILVGSNLEGILKLREELIDKLLKFYSLPELMKMYIQNPHFFNNEPLARIKIVTDTNEILGQDLKGRIYGAGEKLIVNTHGLYINSKTNSNNYSIEKNILSEQEFDELLLGIIPGASIAANHIKVYREEDLAKILRCKRKMELEFPCITVIHGDKYLKDPNLYCNELDYIQDIFGFKENGLLISRTLQPLTDLMEHITKKVNYFSQISPLIEPLIFSGPNGVEKLFNKYAYRVMPLILSDGEIIKEAKDKVDSFEDNTPKKNFFAAISNNN